MVEYLGFFALAIILIEVYFGMALLGGKGGGRLVERKNEPAAFWLTIALHALVGLALPVFYWLVAG